MDSDVSSPTQENSEQKAEFRKITNEAANRKYRRRSPNSGSSDGDGSPTRDRSSRDASKANHVRRSTDKMDDRSSSRSQHGRSSDSYRHSSRGNRHDEHSRYGRHADEDDRSHDISSRSGRESRGGFNADGRDRERDYNRSRDRYKDVDRYLRDKSERPRYEERHGGRYDDRDRHTRDKYHHRDEKREYRSSRDHRGDRSVSYENPMGRQNDFNSKKETGDMKDVGGSKVGLEKSDKEELDRHEDKHGKVGGSSEDRSTCVSEDSEAKRPKFGLGINFRKGSEQDEDPTAKVSPAHVSVSDADIATSVDAAKVAAMKAAQLVNQNLTSTGFMTADQKKKLLWGSKKSNGAEESSHRWETSLFPDRERQEKFQKLMSLRLPWYIWPIVGCEGRSEGGVETSKQSRCREAESTSARFREAVHCWASTKRWSYCRVRSINLHLGCSLAWTLFKCLIYYVRIFERVVLYPLKIVKNSNILFSYRVWLPSVYWLPGSLLCFSFGFGGPYNQLLSMIYMIYLSHVKASEMC